MKKIMMATAACALACVAFSEGPQDIQPEIDRVAAAGGGEVTISGERLLKPFRIKSGVTLRLADDAVVRASTNLSDYVGGECEMAFILAEGERDVGIVGKGVIDGNGGAFRERGGLVGESPPTAVPVLIRFSRCRDVRLEDFTFRRAPAWGIHLRNSDGVAVRRVKAFSHVNQMNDGIDVESRNVTIEDCDLDTDDDAIVFKSESDPSFVISNVVVRNCRLASCCNFIKFGTGSYGAWRDVLVEKSRLRRAGASWRFDWSKRIPGTTQHVTGLAGIALEVVDGGTMENVTVRDVSWSEGVQTPIFVRFDRRHEPAAGKWTGFRNVLVENVRGTAESRVACSVTGVPGRRIGGVTIRDVSLTFPGGGTAEEAKQPVPESIKRYPDLYMFNNQALPAWGFYVRHAGDVRFENVRLRLASNASDARPPVVRDDADGVTWID